MAFAKISQVALEHNEQPGLSLQKPLFQILQKLIKVR